MLKKPVKFTKFLAQDLHNLSSSGYFITGHTDKINSFDINSECSKIITSSSDLTIKLWDLETGFISQEFSTTEDNKTVLFYNEKYAVSTAHDENFNIWDLVLNELAYTCYGSASIKDITVICGKNLIITACSDKNFYLWTFPSFDLFQVIYNDTNFWRISFMETSINSDLIVFKSSCSEIGKSSIFLLNINQNSIKKFTDCSFIVINLILDKKSEVLFYTTDEKIIRKCFINQFKSRKSPILSSTPRSFSINPKETLLFLGLDDKKILILDTEDLKIQKVFKTINSLILGLKFDSVRNELLSYSDDNTLNSFSLCQEKESLKFVSHSGCISSLAWTSDEFHFASGSNDKTVKLWCQEENYYLKTFEGHENSIKSLKFSSSEQFLVSASTERVFVWKVK
jgi:WD40 repeat protein